MTARAVAGTATAMASAGATGCAAYPGALGHVEMAVMHEMIVEAATTAMAHIGMTTFRSAASNLWVVTQP
jgi:hypothetical protein